MKRKKGSEETQPRKRQRHASPEQRQTRQSRVLASSYISVVNLREYLRKHLPLKSTRRKKLSSSLGEQVDALLDDWRVGLVAEASTEVQTIRSKELHSFTQSQSRQTQAQTRRTQTCSIEDVLSFVVWHLFNTCKDGFGRPSNVLCNGLQRGVATEGIYVAPGIVQAHPNEALELLKSPSWSQVFASLGSDGDMIFAGLLLDCGLFSLLSAGKDNYYQVSGVPINTLNSAKSQTEPTKAGNVIEGLPRKPCAITFVRNRMLYAKPSVNAKGLISFGLKHIHVLRRRSNTKDEQDTIHFMKHVFPRQFGLHNVFTSSVDKKTTTQPFYDYLYREDEINAQQRHPGTWLPRRLRGPVLQLAQSIRRRHAKCAYVQKLRHYCSLRTIDLARQVPAHVRKREERIDSSGLITQIKSSRRATKTAQVSPRTDREQSFLAHATPTASVASFCKSVLRDLLPLSTFGRGQGGVHNWTIVLSNVESFIHMRRFESTSLHQVCQNIRVAAIPWLVPPGMLQGRKLSKQERDKRLILLWEFMYYVFDSILIPLVQANFYATETGTQRNKLFYFRHDVWRKMAEPSLASLRTGLYQQMRPDEVRRMLNTRTLGYSQIRLLPKNEGTRTITNLRRRTISTVKGRRVLSSSINAQLAPVFGALSSERHSTPERLGGAILSVSGLHERLMEFKKILPADTPLYFAKVDVQSCFDSIPQNRLLALIETVLQAPAYRTSKYVEIKSGSERQTRQRYVSIATPANSTNSAFSVRKAGELSTHKGGRIFTEVGYQKVWSTRQLLELLQQHVQNNVVKIGKKHFRQTQGIPQGSVLSSLLCSLFYASFEEEYLGRLDPASSLLVRLIDDFLLITTDRRSAQHFLQALATPNAEYGIVVNAEKTLANFEATIGSHKVPRHTGSAFPYCGVTIHTADLQLGKDRYKKDLVVAHGLTVDTTRKAGLVLGRKVRLSLVQQLLRMLMDSDLNQPWRRLLTLMEAFEETAMKMHQYIRNLTPARRPSSIQMMRIIDDLARLGIRYGQQMSKSEHGSATHNGLSRQEISWALADAFEHVFSRKQSQYRELLEYVGDMKQKYEAGLNVNHKTRRRLVAQRNATFVDYVY